MDLGISLLTDDQLVELLIEACNALAERDPIVRKAAQGEIDKKAEELRILREKSKALLFSRQRYSDLLEIAIEKAVSQTRREFIQELEDEVADSIRKEIAAGRVRVMSVEEEGDAVVDAVVACGEIRIHVNSGYSSGFVASQLGELGIDAVYLPDNVLCVVMSQRQREKFMRMPGGAAHRIEVVQSTKVKV